MHGREALQVLIEDQAALEQEVGQPIRFKINEGQDGERAAGRLGIQFEAQVDGAARDAEQLAWLLRLPRGAERRGGDVGQGAARSGRSWGSVEGRSNVGF